jgi:hypothetical protein
MAFRCRTRNMSLLQSLEFTSVRGLQTEVPLRFEAETLDLSLFYKGFAHLVDFLARAYGHFGFRHRAWEI